jgi:hypothetical protein
MVFIVLLWVQNRKRYNGLQWFALDFIAHFVCLLLIFLRGIVPDFVSIVLSNTLAVLGAFWGLIGFSRFVGYKQNYLLNYLYIPVFVLIHTYFSLYSPSLYIRNLNVSVAHLFFAFQCGQVIEFQNEELQHAIENTKLSRFNLTHYSLYMYGLCSKFDRANKRKKKNNNHKKEK